MPAQRGVAIEYCSFMVCGSRKSRRFNDSATMIADLPSGEKYMLYGSSTGSGVPGLPVLGSTGVRLPSVRPSALLATNNVCRSHDGTTCCGLTPTLNLSTTLNVAGSITYTSFDCRFGTYTRTRSPLTVGLKRPATASLYRFLASATGGMPGTVVITSAGGATAGVLCARLGAAISRPTTPARGKKWEWRCDFTNVPEWVSSTTELMDRVRVAGDQRRAVATLIAATVCATMASTASCPRSVLAR